MMLDDGRFSIGPEIINRGSNSVVYEAHREGKIDATKYVAKCSIDSSNYISFNLQRHSYQLCNEIFDEDIIVPEVYGYYKDNRIGEILILEKVEDIYDIDFIVNRGYYYAEIVISKIAKAISTLHNHSISGYDIELYWNPNLNKLVLLDVGPEYTIGIDTFSSIRKHWEIEKDNYMGLWNIESQILEAEWAKQIFKTKAVKDQSVETVLQYINPSSLTMHIENVAKVHALSIFGKISPGNRSRLLDIFIKEYKKNCEQLDMDSQRYISSLKKGVLSNLNKAKAKLYYSMENTLSEESCYAEIMR